MQNKPLSSRPGSVLLTRRDFAQTVAAASATMMLGSLNVLGANNRVRLGFIGVGNRGDQVLDAFLRQEDVQVVAVCDLNQGYMDFAARKIGTAPRQFKDYRRMLEMTDLDAVVINTPDHWHALQTIHACQAGKDVYVEKPLSLRVQEGRQMVEAVEKYKRVCQVGIHRRSQPYCKDLAEFIKGGGIGHVTMIRSFHVQNEWPNGIGMVPDEAVPAELDWDAWLGPAPKVPYNRNRAYYRFRWFYDYSGGQVTNFGVHYIDLIHSCLGQSAPETVAALGGKFVMNDNREVPDTLEAMWQYPGGTLVTFTQVNANAAQGAGQPAEVEFRGTKGTIYFRSNGYDVIPERISGDVFPARSPLTRQADGRYRADAKTLIQPLSIPANLSGNDTIHHARNFVDCIKSRQQCNCDIETGHRSTSATLIANIAHQTSSTLHWDAAAERFRNNTAANKLLSATYRPPYKMPRV